MRHEKQYTKEQLIWWLQDFAEELGKTPTKLELDSEPPMPASNTYKTYFGCYSNACRAAGLKVNKPGRKKNE
ncbi:MAG: homing endonuclease associated repeat-containing protein [Bacillota bacterium]